MSHSCFPFGLLHTTTKRLLGTSAPNEITRKNPRLAGAPAPARGGHDRGRGGGVQASVELRVLYREVVRHQEVAPSRAVIFALVSFQDQ